MNPLPPLLFLWVLSLIVEWRVMRRTLPYVRSVSLFSTLSVWGLWWCCLIGPGAILLAARDFQSLLIFFGVTGPLTLIVYLFILWTVYTGKRRSGFSMLGMVGDAFKSASGDPEPKRSGRGSRRRD